MNLRGQIALVSLSKLNDFKVRKGKIDEVSKQYDKTLNSHSHFQVKLQNFTRFQIVKPH